MIKFACPTCGNSLSAPENKSGSLSSCPACAQMVQVPVVEGSDTPRRREGSRAFFALLRFFLWGLCFAAVVIAVVNYYLEHERHRELLDKTLFALQSLVFVLGSYFIARTFDDSTKSLEELCARLRRKK
jgi:uncharacterized paraquat-inducible protein A